MSERDEQLWEQAQALAAEHEQRGTRRYDELTDLIFDELKECDTCPA